MKIVKYLSAIDLNIKKKRKSFNTWRLEKWKILITQKSLIMLIEK